MSVGDPNRHRPPEPHVQTMRVPTMADIDFARRCGSNGSNGCRR